MIRDLFIFLGAAAALVTLPGSIELLLLTLAGVLPQRRLNYPVSPKGYRLAAIVPAHNEELHIGRCVRSLLAAGRGGLDTNVIVVADNCTDQTATVAAAAGARILIRTDHTERGKGYALNFAFHTLASEGWDGFVIVDADSEVAPNFLTELAAPLNAGAAAAQCRYVVANARESMRTRLMKVANSANNVLRPRGRERCGLSCGIYGNGFALAAGTLRDVPFNASSVVEDAEYHLSLIGAGKRVRFIDTTSVYGDMPVGGAGVNTQRARWEGGRFRLLRERSPQLIVKVLQGGFSFLEPCLDLLLLPLAFHVCLLLLAAATPSWSIRAVGLCGIGIVILHLAAANFVTRGGFQDVAVLLVVPFYILWKIFLIPKLVVAARAQSAWTRTERAPQRNLP